MTPGAGDHHDNGVIILALVLYYGRWCGVMRRDCSNLLTVFGRRDHCCNSPVSFAALRLLGRSGRVDMVWRAQSVWYVVSVEPLRERRMRLSRRLAAVRWR